MTKLRLAVAGGVAIAGIALDGAFPQAQQRGASTPASTAQERAQDQPFPPGSPFATLPGFKVTRVTPADKTESLIVVTFDALGRPVVSQSSSGSGVSPRLLLDNNNDGIFETEKIVSDKLNTCHGLFYESRTVLYGVCRGEVPGDPPPAPPPPPPAAAPVAGGAAGAPGAPQGGAPGGRGGGGQQAPAVGISGIYRLEDTNGDDVMDNITRLQTFTSGGMGDHGPHAIRRGPDGSIMVVVGNNTYVGRLTPPPPQPAAPAAPAAGAQRGAGGGAGAPAPGGGGGGRGGGRGTVNDDAVDKANSPNWNNIDERQFLPQYNDPNFGNSTRLGVHATLWRLQPDNRLALIYSGMRNPYDFAYTTTGEAFIFDSDMEWDVNSPWYRDVRTVHAVPGGDSGYRNGTGKFHDDYFDTLPAVRHMRRGSPVGVETYQSYAYPARFFDNLLEADWSRGRLLYTALTKSGATFTGREDVAEFVHGEPMPISDLEVGPDGNVYFTTGGNAGTGGLYKVTWTGAPPAQPAMTGILAVVRQPQPLSSWGWAAIERAKASMGAAFATELVKLAKTTTAAARDRARAVLELQRHGGAPADVLSSLLTDPSAEVRAAVVLAAGQQTTDAAKAVAARALKDTDPLVQRRAAEALVRQGLSPDRPSFAPIADIYALLNSPDRFVRYAGRLALEHTPRAEWAPRVMAETNILGLTEGLLALSNTKTSEADLRPIFAKTIELMKRPGLTADQKSRMLRAFQVAATETASGVDPELRKEMHDALITPFKALAPTAAFDACTNRSVTTGCSITFLAHSMAKVLAYTGEPDVIDPILALATKAGGARGQADQMGQLDYIYALRVVERGWTPAQVQKVGEFYAKASNWRGGNTFSGHVNNMFEATIDAFTPEQKQATYVAVPRFAPVTVDQVAAAANAAAGRGGGGGGRGAGAAAGAPAAGAPAPAAAGAPVAGVAPDPAGAAAAAAPAAGRGGGGGGGRGRGAGLDSQERYDNLVFPRGSGPGMLGGRGGGPNPATGAQLFEQACASCHKFGAVGSTAYGPDLSTIAPALQRRDLLRAIFFPSEKVDPKFAITEITTRDGKTLLGLVVSETTASVVLKTLQDAQPLTIAKADITRRTKDNATSFMPDDMADRVAAIQVAPPPATPPAGDAGRAGRGGGGGGGGGDQNIAHIVAYLMAGVR